MKYTFKTEKEYYEEEERKREEERRKRKEKEERESAISKKDTSTNSLLKNNNAITSNNNKIQLDASPINNNRFQLDTSNDNRFQLNSSPIKQTIETNSLLNSKDNSSTSSKKKNDTSGLLKSAKGNVFQKVAGTTGDILTNVGKGFFGATEGTADMLTYGIADVSDLIGGKNNKVSKALRKNADFNSTGALFGTNENKQDNFVQGWSDRLDEYSVAGDLTDTIAQGVGQIGSYVGQSYLLGKTGLPETKANALITFSSSYGNKYSSLRQAGYTDNEAKTQALISGLSETLSEQFFSGLPGFKSAGWGDKLTEGISNSVGSYFGSKSGMFARTILSGLGEGTEEVLSNTFTQVGNDIAKFIYDKTGVNDRYINENYTGNISKDFANDVLNKDTLNAFISASLTSAILNSAPNIVSIQDRNKIIEQYAKENNVSKQEATKVYEDIYKANTRTNETMEKINKKYDLTEDQKDLFKTVIYSSYSNGENITNEDIESLYNTTNQALNIEDNITQNDKNNVVEEQKTTNEVQNIENVEENSTNEITNSGQSNTNLSNNDTNLSNNDKVELTKSEKVKSIKENRKEIRNINKENEKLSDEIKEIRELRKSNSEEQKEIKSEIKKIKDNNKEKIKPLKDELKNVNEDLKNVKEAVKNAEDGKAKDILLSNVKELNSKKNDLNRKIKEENQKTDVLLRKYNEPLNKLINEANSINTNLEDKNKILKDNTKKQKELNKANKKNITKQTIRSDEKLSVDVADGSIIEATKPIDFESKKGKKYLKNSSGNSKARLVQKNFVSKGIAVEQMGEASGNKDLVYKYYERTRSNAKSQYKIGKLDENVFNELKTDIQKTDFADYMYLKLNAERLSKGKNGVWTGDLEIDEKTSRELAKEYEKENPKFKELSKKIYEFENQQINDLIESGFASEDAREYFYETYVPTIRELSGSKNTQPTLTQSKSSNIKSPIKRAKGSERDIVDLETALALTTIRNQRAIDENNARKELLNTIGGVVGGERLSFDETHKNGDNYSMTVYKDGRVVTMSVSRDIAEAYTPTKYYEIEELTGILRTASKLQRSVLTQYNPVFLATNLIKDSQDALLNTKFNDLEYLAELPKTIAEMQKRSKEYENYIKEGGPATTYFDTKTNKFVNKNALTKVRDAYDSLSEGIEQVWRFNEYRLTLKHGGSVSEAMYNASEVTTNFSRGGDLSKALDRNGAIFLNASIQGFDKQIRNFTEKGAKGAIRFLIRGALLSIPYIFNQASFGDDDKYKNISDYTKQNNYIIKIGDTYYKIPRGRALSVYTTALQDAYKTAKGEKQIQDALKETGSMLVENIAPNNPIESNVVSPLIQAYRNKNYYGNKIVSDYMSEKDKKEQYDEKTDVISKLIGQSFNLSPKKVNYVIDQYTGFVGDIVLPQLTPSKKDSSNIFKNKFVVNTDTSGQSYYNMNTKANKYEAETKDVNLLNASINEKGKVLASKYLNDIKNDEITPLYKEIDEIRSDPYLSDESKAEQVDELYAKIDEISKSAYDDCDAGVIYDDYAVVGHYEYRLTRNKDGKYIWSKISDDTLTKQEQYSKYYNISAQTYYSSDRINRNLIAGSDKEYDKIQKKITEISDKYKNPINATKNQQNANKINKKNEIYSYINGLNLSIAQKAMLMKQVYSSFDNYDKYIVDYVNKSDLTYEEKTMILLKNGFKYNTNTKQFK